MMKPDDPCGPSAPAVRLALADGQAERNGTLVPSVYLAHHDHAQGDNILKGRNGVEQLSRPSAPALLVSFFYMAPFLKNRHLYSYRNWALDSGAFSAHNSGATIDLLKYTETCRQLLAEDPTLTEVFALDVIGDWRASEKNTRAMWEAGVPAIPTYHVGEPESVLLGLAKDYPKIALGGAVGFRRKDEWAAQCFARVWPKAVHGLGFGSEKSLMTLPWHSVDATNWEIAPCKFGRWQSFGRMSVRGSKQNLKAEVEWYLNLERRARARWAKEMAKLPDTGLSPMIRLAVQQANDSQVRRSGLTGEPNGRLAAKVSGRDGNFMEPSRAEPPYLRLAVDPLRTGRIGIITEPNYSHGVSE